MRCQTTVPGPPHDVSLTVVGRTVAIRRPRERSRLLALWLPHTYSSFAYVLARVTGRRFTLGGS